jgi:hypothetical protein
MWVNGGDLYTLLVGMYISVATMEITMQVLKKLKIEFPYDPTIPLLPYIQRKVSQHTIEIHRFMAVLYNSQAKNQWLDKVLFSNKEE